MDLGVTLPMRAFDGETLPVAPDRIRTVVDGDVIPLGDRSPYANGSILPSGVTFTHQPRHGAFAWWPPPKPTFRVTKKLPSRSRAGPNAYSW